MQAQQNSMQQISTAATPFAVLVNQNATATAVEVMMDDTVNHQNKASSERDQFIESLAACCDCV